MQAVSEATASAARRPAALPRRTIAWLLAGVAAALFVGTGLPPLVITFLKLVPNDAEIHYASEPAPGRLPAPQGARAGDPECADAAGEDFWDSQASSPLECVVVAGDITVEQQVATAKGSDRDEALAESTITVSVDGAAYATVTDELVLDRGSAQPVPGTTQRHTVEMPAGDHPAGYEGPVSGGLRYFFPFNTERRSYLNADDLIRAGHPLDYVETVDIGDLRAYLFAQHVAPERLHAGQFPLLEAALGGDAAPAVFGDGVAGSAQRFYPPEQLDRRGLDAEQTVTVYPYVAVDREVFVEPDTGRVLDARDAYSVFFAANDAEAREFHDTEAASADGRHLMDLTRQWDDSTRQAMYDDAAAEKRQLRVLQILAWVGRAVAAVLIAVIVWKVVTYRRSLAP